MARIPFYQQTFDFSCGPASLMMVLVWPNEVVPVRVPPVGAQTAALKEGYQPGRDEELAIWREATLMEVYGTSRYGLALAAVRRGLKATVVGPPGKSYVDAIGHLRPEVDFEMMREFQADLRSKALAAGVAEIPEALTMAHLEKGLAEGGLPIALTTTALFDPDEGDIPHWVVISAVEGDTVVVENPLGSEGATQLARKEWEAICARFARTWTGTASLGQTALGYGNIYEGLVVYRP